MKQFNFKTILSTLLLFGLITACNSKKAPAQEESSAIQMDSLPAMLDTLVGKTVEVEGFCVDVCGHGSSHITLIGNDTLNYINAQANKELASFKPELINTFVTVTGTVVEKRVDEAFLNDWEYRLDESLKGNNGNPEAVKQIKEQQIIPYRQAIAERKGKEGKDYLSFYHIEASSYKMKE